MHTAYKTEPVAPSVEDEKAVTDKTGGDAGSLDSLRTLSDPYAPKKITWADSHDRNHDGHHRCNPKYGLQSEDKYPGK